METYINCGAVILAAGMSKRMKAFKPLLELGGSTMIRRCISNYLEAGASPVIIVTGNNADLIEENVNDLPVEFVFNPEYENCDMFTSVKKGIAEIAGKCSRLFISPADIPLVSQATLKALIERKEDVVRPAFNGKTGHPVLLSADLIPDLLAFAGDGGLKGALENVTETGDFTYSQVEVNDPGILLDADTPEDYEKLKLYYRESYAV